MEIVYKSIDELTPYENNPRHNENAVAAVAASIKEFNFKVPLVIDTNGVVVAGHTRLLAARQLGLSAVPCIIADDLTPEQVRAFRLADNKTAELAGWDFAKLEEELSEISDQFDMSAFGFDMSDFEEEKEIIAALRDSQSGGCFNGMRDADTECLKRGCPYCYDDDEALYCSAKGDEHCRLILSNIAKQ